MDTMKDILVNILGASLFMIPGAFYLKRNKVGKILSVTQSK
jgi:hypothetical protein